MGLMWYASLDVGELSYYVATSGAHCSVLWVVLPVAFAEGAASVYYDGRERIALVPATGACHVM